MKNNIRRMDIPVVRQLALPIGYTNNYHGAMFCSDGKRFIFYFSGYGQGVLSRYDCDTDGWMQIQTGLTTTNSPSSSSYNGDCVYDKSKNKIYYLPGNNAATFYYYDISGKTVSSALSVTNLDAVQYGSLVHTCSDKHASANDDYIYAINGGATTNNQRLYRYSISTNTWNFYNAGGWGTTSALTFFPAAVTNNCALIWMRDTSATQMACVKGTVTRTIYFFDVTTPTYQGALDLRIGGTISTGSMTAYDADTGYLYFVETASRNIGKTKLDVSKAEYSGTVSSGTTTTLTDINADWKEDELVEKFYITITTGSTVQVRKIISNTSNTITISGTMTAPDNTSTYVINSSVVDFGTATSAASTRLDDSSKSWITNMYINYEVAIVGGTGAGQRRYITANASNNLTISAAWSVTPDTTSVYEIRGLTVFPFTQMQVSTSVSYYGNTMEIINIEGVKYLYYWRKGSNGDWFRVVIP